MTQDIRDTRATVDEILFDGRALQCRVSGRLTDFDTILLSAMRHRNWPGSRPRLVGLVDQVAEPLREHHRLLFDEVTTGRHRAGRRLRWFVSSTPMTYDPVWALPILLDPRILKVAAVHELLSFEGPKGPLSDVERRADHLTCLAWLGRYDLFAVSSQAVKAELEQFRAIDPSRVIITGHVVRSGFNPRSAELPIPFRNRRHIAVTVDDSEWMDLEGVLSAHAHSGTRHRFPVIMLGPCPPEMRSRLRMHYGREGGAQDDLKFIDRLSDEAIGDLYRDALLTVVLSRGSEALISSVFESAALGTPAVVPEAMWHADVASASAFRFPQRNFDALARIFDTVANNPVLWEKARSAGIEEGRCHTAACAARRLLDAVVERMTQLPPAPALGHGLRPRLAMLTPLPPATAATAARSAATVEALSHYVDVQAFSDTPGAVSGSTAQPIAPVCTLKLSLQQFDASLCVLGNSRQHAAIFEHLLANGGAALTHDAQLVRFYSETLGINRALGVGRMERDGEVAQSEIAVWTREPREMPILFMSEVARAAAPLLVTSEAAQREIARLYGIAPRRLPPLQHRTFDQSLLAPVSRRARREALGWERDDVVLCSFGLSFAATAVVLWALRLLRDWRVDAHLALRRPSDEGDRAKIDGLTHELDLGKWVTLIRDDLSERAYEDHLMAADMAIQLGNHSLSGPSATIMDCIAASLPVIADDHAACTAAAPAFVRRVPDSLSSVLIAEAALDIVSSGQHRVRPVEEARAFAATYSPDLYARAMTEALGLDHGRA